MAFDVYFWQWNVVKGEMFFSQIKRSQSNIVFDFSFNPEPI